MLSTGRAKRIDSRYAIPKQTYDDRLGAIENIKVIAYAYFDIYPELACEIAALAAKELNQDCITSITFRDAADKIVNENPLPPHAKRVAGAKTIDILNARIKSGFLDLYVCKFPQYESEIRAAYQKNFYHGIFSYIMFRHDVNRITSRDKV